MHELNFSAVAVTIRRDGCIAATQQPQSGVGTPKDEIAAALDAAIALNAGTA
jgi:hypothetical protein